ncbi:MAG: aminotransferase class V-fold PLP-dependent enzyme [Verrucomicrobiota bacterium]
MKDLVYLDNNATTRIADEVLEAMLPWLGDQFGNPSAGYRFGKSARRAIETAREQVAALIDASPDEIVFTSGGTESLNTALRAARLTRPDRRRLVLSSVEHSAVYEAALSAEKEGQAAVTLVPVSESGRLDLEAWADSLDDETVVANLIWANNETGVLSPIHEAGEIALGRDVYFHSDAVQAVGKVPVSVKKNPVHALSLSGHKFHGPKGIGALYLNRHARFSPTFYGGGQESNRRSGTENVAAIVGLGLAAEMAQARIESDTTAAATRDRFERELLEALPDCLVNGDRTNRLPNTSNIYFPGIDGEGLLILLDEAGICCSPGSACSTGSVQPSRIIRAMGHSSSRARSSVRFSLSLATDTAEIEQAISEIVKAAKKLRVVLGDRTTRVISSRNY